MPSHSQSFAKVDGSMNDFTELTLAYGGLIPGATYEVYLFAGSGHANTQDVSIAGETNVSLNQTIDHFAKM